MRNTPKSWRAATPVEELMMDINTTPLIDVMLVLLIMLIITIPVQLHSVNLNMPTGNAPPVEMKPEVLRIDIDAASMVLWNGEAVSDPVDLARRMEQVAAQVPQPELHLRPDRWARYETVAGVMAAAQRLGLSRIGIVGSEQFAR